MEAKELEKEWVEPCPMDCEGGLCDDCVEDDEPDFPAGSNQGYWP